MTEAQTKRSSYLVSNEFGFFCSACGETMGLEEIDRDCCDACGGEGFGGEDDDDFDPLDGHVDPSPTTHNLDEGQTDA